MRRNPKNLRRRRETEDKKGTSEEREEIRRVFQQREEKDLADMEKGAVVFEGTEGFNGGKMRRKGKIKQPKRGGE